ncbi:MAG: tyrosine-type recombinase/integrase [Armatimonadota bacterium]
MQTPSLRVCDKNALLHVMELWLESLQARNCSLRTVQNYRECVTPFLLFLHEQGCRTLEHVEPQHIRRWLLHRQQQGVSSHTLHNSFRNPKAFWNWCLREGLTEHNPFAKIQPPKREQVLKRALTPDEVQRLLAACKGNDWLNLRDRALILLLLDTGLRIHEAHALKVADVQNDVVVVRGKGGKQRVVVLDAEVRLALQRYLKRLNLHPDAPLWWGAYGALTLHGLKLAVRRVGKRAGLTVGPHQLRRTFATWSLRAGIDLEHLRLLMGHSDLKVLQQYLALVEQDLKEAHARTSPVRQLMGRR